jgi:D-alanyl-D-alanine dipeptidase
MERLTAPTHRAAALAAAFLALLFAACASGPPHERGTFREPDLVELTEVPELAGKLRLDIRYATSNNFVGRPVYDEARAFLQRPAAAALARAAGTLAAEGYGVLVFDGYRPWRVTKLFWDVTPPDKHQFVANPKNGSRHNRGCAVDLSLYDLASGAEIEMPSPYDDFTDKASPDYPGGTPEQRARRDLLRAAMEAEGFTVYEHEWWHFDYRDWRLYPVLDIAFAEVPSAR